MAEWRIFIVAIVIFAILAGIVFAGFPAFQISLPVNVNAYIIPLIILVSFPLAISAFLPFRWGKILREISYFSLFILLILLQSSIFQKVFSNYTPPSVTLQQCTSLFGISGTPTSAWDVVSAWSCVTTGYFPASGTSVNFTWTIFAIFYIILPFAFITTLVYGFMKGMPTEIFFGNFAGTATKVLSFIIAMYASRLMFGYFLLTFYSYGVWGLAGVFGAAFITVTLKNIMDKWYNIEAMGEGVRQAIQAKEANEKNAINNLRSFVNGVTTIDSLNELRQRGTMAYHGIYQNLPWEMQAQIEAIIFNPSLDLNSKKQQILALI